MEIKEGTAKDSRDHLFKQVLSLLHKLGHLKLFVTSQDYDKEKVLPSIQEFENKIPQIQELVEIQKESLKAKPSEYIPLQWILKLEPLLDIWPSDAADSIAAKTRILLRTCMDFAMETKLSSDFPFDLDTVAEEPLTSVSLMRNQLDEWKVKSKATAQLYVHLWLCSALLNFKFAESDGMWSTVIFWLSL
jgi:hypothetical protein